MKTSPFLWNNAILLTLLAPSFGQSNDYCCSWNYRDCGDSEWCNAAESNCMQCGGGRWIVENQICDARWDGCVGTEEHAQGDCCPGLWCEHHDQHWHSCQPAPDGFVGNSPISPAPITLAPVTSAPVTLAPDTPAPVTAAPMTLAPVTPAPVTPAPVTPAPVTLSPVTSAPVTPAPVTAAPVTPAPVTASPVTPAPATPSPITLAPVTIAPMSLSPVTPAPISSAPYSCLIPENVLDYAIISETDTVLSKTWINGEKGLLVGGNLIDGSTNSWLAVNGESYVGGEIIGEKWNWNGNVHVGTSYKMEDFVDFGQLKYITQRSEPIISGNYEVVVINNGGEFGMDDLFPGKQPYNDGYYLAIFNTNEDVTLVKEDGKDIGFSTLAPMSTVIVDESVSSVLGFVIGREVIDNSQGSHGKNYAGGVSCFGPTPAPVTPIPTTPAPTKMPTTPFPTLQPVTPAPIPPTNFPPGPYVAVQNANERIAIPDPPVPNPLPRGNCPHEATNVLDWHSASTWGGSIPTSGDITLPTNAKIILRQSVAGVLGTVTIPSSSELIFGESEDGISFEAHGVKVEGRLVAGSETCRLEGSITLTLHGTRPSDAVTNVRPPVFKGIDVTGEISLHGLRFYHTWTRLALTVEPGDTILMLQHQVNWLPGQQIVLVTTAVKDSREWHRNEVATILNVVPNPVSGVGAAVILDSPVMYQHVANNNYQGEVGLLTRSIKIQGNAADSEPTDPDPLNCQYGTTGTNRNIYGDKGRPCPNTELTGFGGHIMVHSGGKGYVEGVELHRMGQTNVLGRYPMHFHLLGNGCSDCYFRDSSVHRSFYRCVSIHGTHYTHISENVAYDVTGYCYYLEDGVEHDNRIEYNLGAHIHMIGSEPPWGYGQTTPLYFQSNDLTLPADVTASAFYITNVKNYIIGNAASGGWAGFAFPNLRTPLGPHRDEPLRPSSVTELTIDGNTAHSSSWWWYHAAAFYWGGSLYYQGDTLVYNAGRDQQNGRNSCLVNKCEVNKNCGAYCQPWEQNWLKVTNTKAFLAPGVGFGSWSGRMEIVGFECHDCGLSMESLSDGFWINKMLAVCRTKTPLVMPVANANSIPANGFTWYDTNQEHIITEATFRNCGYRSAEYDHYDQNPNRGCGDENDIGCRSSSSVWGMLTHSDQFVPEMMQGTRAITFENCGRRFRQQDFRSSTSPSSVSGREQNWYDLDGTVTGFLERSAIGSGLADAGKWWQVDDEAVYDPQGPLWFFKLTTGPERGLGHFRMKWDDSLHNQVGSSQCGNGQSVPCDYVGFIKHQGELFKNDPGLPVTANADIVGPVGGFGWKLELNGGAPRQIRFEQIEVDPATPLLLSIAYPLGTSFTIVAHAGWCSDSQNYSCTETFHQVDSVAEVRASQGNTYHVDTNGVLTFRIIQTPKTYIGRPEFFLPQYSDAGKWNQHYAIDRFERDGVRLPKMAYGPYLMMEADCPSSGAYCTSSPSPVDWDVCPTGYFQTGYDVCTSTSNANMHHFADGNGYESSLRT